MFHASSHANKMFLSGNAITDEVASKLHSVLAFESLSCLFLTSIMWSTMKIPSCGFCLGSVYVW